MKAHFFRGGGGGLSPGPPTKKGPQSNEGPHNFLVATLVPDNMQ
jgi:hypothetical protein